MARAVYDAGRNFMPSRLPLSRGVLAALGWFSIAVAMCGSASAAAPALDKLPGADDRWSHYRSPNFELFSQQSDGESRTILEDLELLRAVFLERFKIVERARLDVTVFSFRSRKDFQAYSTYANEKKLPIAGFYLNGIDRAVIVLAPTEDRDESRHLVFHEYVHHMFRATETDPPAWFDEGMAEVLAGIQVAGDTVQYGHPVLGRVLSLRQEKLLSLDTIFFTGRGSSVYRSGEHKGLFYAQSWALVHFLTCGDSGFPEELIRRFFLRATQTPRLTPTEMQAFFQECFGIDYVEMVKRLEKYVRTGRYSYAKMPRPALPASKTFEQRDVAGAEIELRLAELAVRVNNSPLAQRIVNASVFHDQAVDPRPYELLGARAAAQGDHAVAADFWEKAVAAGTRNVAILRELALIEGQRWFKEFDYTLKIPLTDADRMRTRLLRSIEHEPLQTPAYEMLAWVEAFAEKRSVANVNLVQSNFNKMKKRARTLVALAMVRVRMGAQDEARTLLGSLNALDPDPWTLQAAEVISATLEGRTVQQVSAAAARADEVKSDLTPNFQSQRRLPSVPLPDDL